MGQADIDRLSPTAEDGCRPSRLFGRDDGDVCPSDVRGEPLANQELEQDVRPPKTVG